MVVAVARSQAEAVLPHQRRLQLPVVAPQWAKAQWQEWLELGPLQLQPAVLQQAASPPPRHFFEPNSSKGPRGEEGQPSATDCVLARPPQAAEGLWE